MGQGVECVILSGVPDDVEEQLNFLLRAGRIVYNAAGEPIWHVATSGSADICIVALLNRELTKEGDDPLDAITGFYEP